MLTHRPDSRILSKSGLFEGADRGEDGILESSSARTSTAALRGLGVLDELHNRRNIVSEPTRVTLMVTGEVRLGHGEEKFRTRVDLDEIVDQLDPPLSAAIHLPEDDDEEAMLSILWAHSSPGRRA